jgi:hypothetical protein
MATPNNTRHTQIDLPRVLFTGTKRIVVTADTTSFSSSEGVPTPAAITLTSELFGISGTVNWTVPYGTATLSSSTGTSVTLAFGDMASKVVTVRASVTVLTATYTSDITLTKTEDGIDGADSKYVIINPTGYVFTRDDEFSTYTPSIINLSYTAYGGVVTFVLWEQLIGGSWYYLTGASSVDIASSAAFTGSRTYRVTVTVGGVSTTDQVTLTKLTGGTDAFAGYLTNESVTFATDSSGTTPANIATLTAGTFKVFWGAVDVTGSCTFSKVDFNCATSVTNGTGAYSASDVTSDSATSTITATHTPTGTTVTKVLSLAKSRVGVNGTRTAVLEVYQWAASAPSSFPVGSSVYTWATGQFTDPATLNGWSRTPTVAVTGQTLWIARTVYADSLTTTTSSVTWSAVAAIPTGASGVNGQRVGVLEVYRWSASAPTTYPSGTSVYTWATGAFTDPTTANGWSVTPTAPVAGQTLWGISTIVSDNNTTSTSTATWSSSTVYATGAAGTNGTNGTNGVRTAILDVYQVAAVAPTSFPVGSSTYTWSSGQFTAPATLNGWSLTPPTPVVGQTLWIARTIYSDSFTTSTSTVAWNATSAMSLGVSGVNGANGSRTAVMEVYKWAATAPTTFPAGTSVYTWATGAFTSPTITLDVWSLTPPAPVLGQTLWGCSVKYVDTLTTLTSTITWNTTTAYPISAAGTNAKSLALTADTQVFQIAKTGLVNGVAAGSAFVTFTSVSQNLTGSPALAFNVVGGSGTLSGTGNTRTLLYSSMGSSDNVVVEVTGDGLSDKMTIIKVREGSDAVVGSLSNDSANLPASDAGVVSSYSAATGTFDVYRGSEKVTTSCAFSVITNVDGLTTSINASTGVYSVTAGFPNANNTTSVTYRAVYVYAGQTYTIDKIFSLSKAKSGATGITGAEVDIVFVRAVAPTTPTSDFNPPTAPILWYSNVNNVPVTANPMWSSVGKKAAGGSTWTWEVPIQVEGTDGTTPNVVTEVFVYAASFNAPLTPSGGTYSLGTNAFTVLPTGADIPPVSWVGSMPDVGALPIYESRAVASAPAGGSDNTLTWSSPVKIYENADDGVDAKLMTASVTSQVFQVNKAGVATPTTITLKAIRNNITGATWSVVSGTGTATLRNSTDTGAYVSGDVALLKYENMTSDSVTFRVVDTSTAYEDTITIVKVREGSDALVGYLTNENVTLPAQTDGTVVSYTGASGKFIVLRGATDVTDQCTFAVQANPQSLTPTNNIVTSGTNAGDYIITGGFTTDVASVTYRATYVFNSLTYYVDKVFTLSKSKTGTTGAVGSAGSSARIAYVKLQPPPIGTDPSGLSPTPSTQAFTGDVFPTTGTWGESNAWLAYPPSIVAGEQVWQTTGVYNYLTNQTTWVSPYLSNLKVGNLSAITVNTGTLTVDASGYVRGGQTGYNTGTGFWLGYDGGAYKFSIGTSSEGITWDGTTLLIKGSFQVGNAVRTTTTMTGSGAEIKSDGGFALGNSSGNINYDTTKMTMNGDWWGGTNWRLKQSANNYLAIGVVGSSTLRLVRADNNGNPALTISDTNTSGLDTLYIQSTAAAAGLYSLNANASGFAADFAGRFRLGLGTASPIILGAAAGRTGQTLISQGSSATPAWGKQIFSGAQAADGSGNLTVTVDFPDTSYAPVATSTSGVYVVITAKSATSITFQAQDRATGAGVASAGISWIAIG